MINDDYPRQPELTSHTLELRAASRGKQHYDVHRAPKTDRPRNDFRQDRPRNDFRQAKSRQNRSPTPGATRSWTHENELKAFVGKKIELVVDGSRYEVVLLEADAFTLKVRLDTFAAPSVTQIVFKSSITSIGLPAEISQPAEEV